jgi:hypothetical protein
VRKRDEWAISVRQREFIDLESRFASAAAREDVDIMTNYLPIIIPFLIGMGLFGFLRQRDKDPMISGMAATFLSMALVVAYYAFAITTGRL